MFLGLNRGGTVCPFEPMPTSLTLPNTCACGSRLNGPPTAVTSPRTTACGPSVSPPTTATTSPVTSPSIFTGPTIETTSPCTRWFCVTFTAPPPIRTMSPSRCDERDGVGGSGAAADGAGGAAAASGDASCRCSAALRYVNCTIGAASAPSLSRSCAAVSVSPSTVTAPLMIWTMRTRALAAFGTSAIPCCSGTMSYRFASWVRSSAAVAVCA